jgi:hypothetical protein
MGLLAMGLTASTIALTQQKMQWPVVLLLGFGATGMYAMLRLWSLDRHPEWSKWTTLFKAEAIAGLLAGLILAYTQTIHLPLLTLLGSLTIGYTRLRKIPYLKTFLLSAVFALLPLTVYWALEEGMPLTRHLALFLTGTGILIWSVTLLFDSRDAMLDRQVQLRTLPQLLGSRTTWSFSLTGISLAMGIHLFTPVHLWSLMMAYSPVAVAALLWPHKQQHSYWYAFLDLALVWFAWGYYLGLPL